MRELNRAGVPYHFVDGLHEEARALLNRAKLPCSSIAPAAIPCVPTAPLRSPWTATISFQAVDFPTRKRLAKVAGARRTIVSTKNRNCRFSRGATFKIASGLLINLDLSPEIRNNQ